MSQTIYKIHTIFNEKSILRTPNYVVEHICSAFRLTESPSKVFELPCGAFFELPCGASSKEKSRATSSKKGKEKVLQDRPKPQK